MKRSISRQTVFELDVGDPNENASSTLEPCPFDKDVEFHESVPEDDMIPLGKRRNSNLNIKIAQDHPSRKISEASAILIKNDEENNNSQEGIQVMEGADKEGGDDPEEFKKPEKRWLGWIFPPISGSRQCFPWNIGNIIFQMAPEFRNPRFRTRFIGKMMLVKSFQWSLVTLWSLLLPFYLDPSVGKWIIAHFWTNYLSLSIYIFMFFLIRSTHLAWTFIGRISTLIINDFCLAYVCGCFFLVEKSPIIPVFAGTIALTFAILAFALLMLTPLMNWTQNGSSGLTCSVIISIFLMSIVLGLGYHYWAPTERFGHFPQRDKLRSPMSGRDPQSFAKFIGFWIPAWLIASALGIIEVLEMEKIVGGERLALNNMGYMTLFNDNWLIASVFII